MKFQFKSFLAGFIIAGLLFTSFPTFAKGASEVLEVVVNKLNIKVNGKAVGSTGDNYTLDNRYKVPVSIIYKGTTYFFETSYLCL